MDNRFKYAIPILAIIALICCYMLNSCGGDVDSFMPDNDLWKLDNVHSLQAGKSEAEFRKIASDLQKVYAVDAKKNKETLVVNALWEDKTVNANCQRTYKKVIINLYGGLYRNNAINSQGFALVAAHEASHAYAGKPYYKGETLSTEGNSDHFSSKDGYWRLAPLNPSLNDKVNPSAFIKKTCSKYYGVQANDKYNICLNILIGGESLAGLLAQLNDDPMPDYETPDTTVVKKTLESYPSIQCRLDSYLAGAINAPRSRCWFYK